MIHAIDMVPLTRIRMATLRLLAVAWLCLAAMLVPGQAAAQTTYPYTNNTTTTLDSNRTCASPAVRTFNVTDSFTLGDVNLGVYATHSWRGDIRITLQSPDGTRVQVVNGDTSAISGDNFNVLLDDSGSQVVNTDGATSNHSTTAPPPFQHTFRPNNGLSAFVGKSSVGNWRVEVCDLFPTQDNGVLRYVGLYLTSVAPNTVDLSLLQTVDDNTPNFGQNVTFSLQIANAAYSTSGSVNATVSALLPAGFTYVSHSGSGSYNPTTGLWSVTGLGQNQSQTVTIVATVTASSGAVLAHSAEIATATVTDMDSTPGNGVTIEDDYASTSLTVQGTRVAGTPPTLVCAAGALQFNWTGRTWTAGSTTNNYTLAGFGAFNWSINNPATWMNDAGIGGLQPALTTSAQGVLSLSKGIDFATRTQIATTTITLGEIVDGAQFTVFDVDYVANDFADLIRVTGRHNGATVIPVLTNGISNYVIGNTAYGDAASDAASANGNVIVTFNDPIDTIVIEYGNHSLAPANPDGQAVQMAGGITICEPQADLAVTKTSEVLPDPETGSAFPVPGGLLRYCITIQNNGSATAAALTASDTLPINITFATGSIRSGTTCNTATEVEDDDASDSAETDAIKASFAADVIAFSVTTLASGQTAAVTFEAEID
jgi:uncharacterized repeat protein (TIGR01451 family)